MTGGMVIVSYTSLSATAGSFLMIQGINKSMTMTWFNQQIDDVVQPANHLWANHEESQTWRKAITRKAILTVQRTGYAATATPVDPIIWDALMDAELENTRPFNTATTPLIVRQLLKNWASTIPQQWQAENKSGLEPQAIGSTFK
jgi:hypothetical protein